MSLGMHIMNRSLKARDLRLRATASAAKPLGCTRQPVGGDTVTARRAPLRLALSHAILAVACASLASIEQAWAAAAACTGSEVAQSFSFGGTNTWPNGTLTKSFTVGTGADQVTLTFTSDNTGGDAFDSNFPGLATSGNIAETLRHSHSAAAANVLLSTLTLTVDRPINKLRYVNTDVDYSSGNWQDQIVASANNGAAVFPTAMTSGIADGRHSINLATGTATGTTSSPNCSATQAGCNITVDYNLNNITSSSTQFRTGPAIALSSSQNIGWNQFSWCLPPAANLGITKTDGASSVNAGGTVTYTIVVSNAGPSAANNAIFTDPAVANLSVTGVSCGSPTGGAACPAPAATTVALMQGAGIVIPTLPSGGSVTFTVSGTAGSSGSIANIASIAPPSGTVDPTPANNSTTDSNTILAPSLVFLKSLAIVSDPVNGASNPKFIPGAIADYTLRVTNTGPGTVELDSLILEDPVPANTELFVGDLGGAGSGPVAFTDGSPGSALTWTFSSLAPAPVDDLFFYDGSSWNYQPTGTYDPNVTRIRMNPKGSMAADTGSGSPYFELRFRVRVK